MGGAPLDRKTVHDLMSPLNAIIGFSWILLEKAAASLDEKQLGNLRRIHESGKNLLERIRALGEGAAPAPARARVDEETPAPAPAVAFGAKILVVDDAASNRELLKQDLEDAGFTVATQGDGHGALEMARTWEPALVILDIDMPGIDGIETCRRLKADPITAHIPVLFVTGAPDEETVITALAAGGNDFLTKPYSRSILVARSSTQIAIYEAQSTLRNMVIVDSLTGVFSRRYVYETLNGLLARHARSGKPLAAAIVDVDHFKRVNDERGHLEGDRVLKAVADLLRTNVRSGDVVARVGGEEFVIVMPDADLDLSRTIAERIRAAVEKGTRGATPVTISAGVARFDPAEKDLVRAADDLFRRADEALYRAKRAGRNRVIAEGDPE